MYYSARMPSLFYRLENWACSRPLRTAQSKIKESTFWYYWAWRHPLSFKQKANGKRGVLICTLALEQILVRFALPLPPQVGLGGYEQQSAPGGAAVLGSRERPRWREEPRMTGPGREGMEWSAILFVQSWGVSWNQEGPGHTGMLGHSQGLEELAGVALAGELSRSRVNYPKLWGGTRTWLGPPGICDIGWLPKGIDSTPPLTSLEVQWKNTTSHQCTWRHTHMQTHTICCTASRPFSMCESSPWTQTHTHNTNTPRHTCSHAIWHTIIFPAFLTQQYIVNSFYC